MQYKSRGDVLRRTSLVQSCACGKTSTRVYNAMETTSLCLHKHGATRKETNLYKVVAAKGVKPEGKGNKEF